MRMHTVWRGEGPAPERWKELAREYDERMEKYRKAPGARTMLLMMQAWLRLENFNDEAGDA